MPVKKIFFFLICFLFVFSKPSYSISFYKFSSSTNSDWVEIINDNGENVDLADYSIEDLKGNSKGEFDCLLGLGGIYNISFSNYLNKAGDIIYLKQAGEIIECVAYGDQVCPGKSEADLPELITGEFGLKQEQSWVVSTDSSETDNRVNCVEPTATPTDTPPPTGTDDPSPTPDMPTDTPVPDTPTPTEEQAQKAVLTIHQPKDSDDEEISQVKIYLDNEYTHHYDNEEFSFCDSGCDAGFGFHTIKLEKSGYQNYEENINMQAGETKDLHPVLQEEDSPDSTNTPTPQATQAGGQATPTLTLTPTQEASATATKSEIKDIKLDTNSDGEVLGEEDLEENSTNEKQDEKNSGKFSKIIAFIFIILGAVLIGIVAFYPQLEKLFDKIKKDGKEKKEL